MTEFRQELEVIDAHLKAQLSFANEAKAIAQLKNFSESLSYSLFSGGKRFRPVLSLLTAKALNAPYEKALPLASAVELIHTYSLIHDDLPCMDNDDFRRGRPTHHKVYGEGTALLAGDALLTMAFETLVSAPSAKTAEAILLLAVAAGPRGMIGGQVLDVQSQNPSAELLEEIHRKKTGALIRVSTEAAALLCDATAAEVACFRTYGEHLGMAFQLADDVQDHNPDKPEKVSYTSLLGVEETKKRLFSETEMAVKALKGFSAQADPLRQLALFNRDRIG